MAERATRGALLDAVTLRLTGRYDALLSSLTRGNSGC